MTKGEEIVAAWWGQPLEPIYDRGDGIGANWNTMWLPKCRDLARRIDEALAVAVTEMGHRWVNACDQWHNSTRERDQLSARLALAERVVEAARKLREAGWTPAYWELSRRLETALAEWGKG